MNDEKRKCPNCGEVLTCWRRGHYLDLREGILFSAPDFAKVDVYSCPGCGKLEFFRPDFLPKEKKHVPVEPEPDSVDTTGYYVPGIREDVKCPVCGKEHPADDLFCPLCGTRRDQPCAWCGKRFPAGEAVCPHCGARREST